jgi:hypothetical protein
MINVKCVNALRSEEIHLMMYFYVMFHPGIAQTLHGRLPQKLKDVCVYIYKFCSTHFLKQ